MKLNLSILLLSSYTCVAATTIGGPTISPAPGGGSSSGVDTNAVIALIEQYGGGGGAYVSNQIEMSFTVDVWRTNNTPQIWVVDATITASPGGGNGFCVWEVDTNLNGTADWDNKRSGVNGGTDVVHGTLGGIILPGWAFRYFNNSVGGSAGPEADTGSIYYYSTNSSSGGSSWAATATTATNVDAESVLTITKRSRGAGSSGAYHGPILTNSSYSMLIPPGTAGILNKMMIMLDPNPPNYPQTNLNNIALRVVADGVLTVDIRISDLGGVRYQNHSNAWAITTDSRWLEANQDTDPHYVEDYPVYFYQLNFPMPCTNGMYAYLTNVTYGGTWSHGYIAGAYNTFVPDSLKGYRLYCWSTNRAQAASTSNFLFSTTGTGQIIGVQYGSYDADGAQLIYAQGDDGIAFWLNGNQKWQSSGLDDLLGNTLGGAMGRNIGYDRGQTSYNLTAGPSWCEAYRWLNERSAINFTNGFLVYEESNEALDAVSHTFWYLKR